MSDTQHTKEESQAELRKHLDRKLFLESLPTYKAKLDWSVETFGDLYCNGCYSTLTKAEFDLLGADEMDNYTVSDTGEISGTFQISMTPNNPEESLMYYTKMFDIIRADYVNTSRQVNKAGWRVSQSDPYPVAFTITSFDDLKADLEYRLDGCPNATLKKEFLKRQLGNVTNSIDACAPNSDYPHFFSINHLRDTLILCKPYDLIYTKRQHPNQLWGLDYCVTILAEIWDIVHFERYITVRLTNAEHGVWNKAIMHAEHGFWNEGEITSQKPEVTLSSNQTNEEIKPLKKQQAGKLKRYAEYRRDHDNFKSIEGMNDVDAVKAVANKNGVSLDTVERALGWRI